MGSSGGSINIIFTLFGRIQRISRGESELIEPVVTETAVVGLETNASQMQEEEIEELKQLELLALDEITDTLKRIGKNRIEDCATHN